MSNYIVRDSKTDESNIVNDISTFNECYICYENSGNIIFPCKCTGTNRGVHRKCLNKWLEISKKDECQVCKYKYKYNFRYNPSFKRFCYSCIDFSNLEFSNNINIFFFIIIILSIYLFLIVIMLSVMDNPRSDIIVPVFSSLAIFKIFILRICDKSLNILKVAKYTQIFLTFLIYTYIGIRLIFDINLCEQSCNVNNLGCSEKCDLYKEYREQADKFIFALIYQGILMSVIFLVDFCYKIKKGLYEKYITNYNSLINSESDNISRNQILPLSG